MAILKKVTGVIFFTLFSLVCYSQQIPKIEFRGAWIHTVGNQQFKTMSADSIKSMLCNTLDALEASGVNAVIFQVRPQADAFYLSQIEPWSRFLTGEQGKAPQEIWDPLEFMIEQSHKRGMELHAWCNPYRVTSNETEQLHPNHLYFKQPELFKKYGTQIYFDPGEPQAIEHTVKVIADIVSRYDLDAIHFDDYFYPYPIPFEEFHDDASFVKYAKKQGFEYWEKGDWRRNNVATLIKTLNDTIKAIKPWVRFGVSPFGIHRNFKDTPDGTGSQTNGLSNYEQLFADVLLWIEKGWIDYNVPQLYWEIGHPAADYKTLIEWWSRHNHKGHLYIGQSIGTFTEPDLDDPSKTQFEAKMNLVRNLPHVNGNVWWPGWSIANNRNGVADSLSNNYQRDLALIPAYTHLDSVAPQPVQNLEYKEGKITWEESKTDDPLQQAQFYAVYRFPQEVNQDINNSKYLVKIVNQNKFTPELNKKEKNTYYYVITAIDRCRNESSKSKPLKISH
ncbi:MAG: family 10 glycosylhydrolase [Bacteroidales bacterium]